VRGLHVAAGVDAWTACRGTELIDDVTMIKALAVTLEPKGGVPAPTGEKYLVGM
jgi:hypothetical protein